MSHFGVPLSSAETLTGSFDFRVAPSAFEIITDGIEIVQYLRQCQISAGKLPKKYHVPTKSAHGRRTAIHVVDNNDGYGAIQLCTANFVSKRANAAINDRDFPAEFLRLPRGTLRGLRAADRCWTCNHDERPGNKCPTQRSLQIARWRRKYLKMTDHPGD